VSKRRGSRYAAGRTDHWLKVKESSRTGSAAGGRRGLGCAPQMTVALRQIQRDDYDVLHDGEIIGRIYRMRSADQELWR
jgi:hypothetical protein